MQACIRVVSEGLLCSCPVFSRTCHSVSWAPCVLGRRQPLDASIADLGDTEKLQALAAPPCMGQTLEPQDMGLGRRLIQKRGWETTQKSRHSPYERKEAVGQRLALVKTKDTKQASL